MVLSGLEATHSPHGPNRKGEPKGFVTAAHTSGNHCPGISLMTVERIFNDGHCIGEILKSLRDGHLGAKLQRRHDVEESKCFDVVNRNQDYIC